MNTALDFTRMPVWLSDDVVNQPITLNEIKDFSSLITDESNGKMRYTQSLQVTAAGWGYASYELLLGSTVEETFTPYKPFSLSAALAATTRLKAVTERVTSSSTEGHITNERYVKVLNTTIAKVATAIPNIGLYFLDGFRLQVRDISLPSVANDVMLDASPYDTNPKSIFSCVNDRVAGSSLVDVTEYPTHGHVAFITKSLTNDPFHGNLVLIVKFADGALHSYTSYIKLNEHSPSRMSIMSANEYKFKLVELLNV